MVTQTTRAISKPSFLPRTAATARSLVPAFKSALPFPSKLKRPTLRITSTLPSSSTTRTSPTANDALPLPGPFVSRCGIPAARVTRKEDLRAAIQEMLDTPGPYLLDVIVPHQEHVLPMIPSGGARVMGEGSTNSSTLKEAF